VPELSYVIIIGYILQICVAFTCY